MKKWTSIKDRLQNYLRFCFQNSQSFGAFWKQFSASYFVTIPKYIAVALITSLVISACSMIKNSNSKNQQSSLGVVVTQYLPTMPYNEISKIRIAPDKITITSLTELTALFEQLNYNRNNCKKDNCAVPRITFNKIANNWKEASSKLPVKTKKELFFHLMAPLVLIANEKIKKERVIVKNSDINSPEFKTLALKYRLIKDLQTTLDESLRKTLLQRVDILPPSLALAQAAEESGWATSRFASEGNAFFGQWDYSGKGMKPLEHRAHLGNYGVARFDTPLASVESYMLNINRNNAYQKLRILRAQLREQQLPITGYILAGTMDKYSERGLAYVEGLRSMISYNELALLDNAYLADNQLIHIIMD